MADYAYPNRIRAYTALLIYRDAMRRHIAEVLQAHHGEGWLEVCVLRPLRERIENGAANQGIREGHERRMDALERGKEGHVLLEASNIAFLIRDHRDLFRGLRKNDIDALFHIRSVRNEFLEHDYDEGDCGPEVADAITSQCILVLDRCGLSEAAENIRRLSQEIADAPATTQSDKLSRPSQPSSTSERKLCVCGCGFGTKSTFKPGHDGRLVRIIRRGTDAERASVDWQRVPLTFHNGDYAKEIRQYQRNQASR